MGPVIDYLGPPANRTGFQEVDAQAISAVEDLVYPDASLPKLHHGTSPQVILRQPGDKVDRNPVIRQRHGNVRFPAPVDDFEPVSLGESEESRRRQAQHDLAKGHYLLHSLFNLQWNIKVRENKVNH